MILSDKVDENGDVFFEEGLGYWRIIVIFMEDDLKYFIL